MGCTTATRTGAARAEDADSAISAGRKCGYTDHSAFCHAFFNQFGVTPSAFRPRDSLTGPQE